MNAIAWKNWDHFNESKWNPAKDGIRTEDGFTFRLQPDRRTWGDGDLSWSSFEEMVDSFAKEGTRWHRVFLQ